TPARHVAADFQTVGSPSERSHVAPLEIVLHKCVRTPPGLITFDPEHCDTRDFRVIDQGLTEGPSGGEAELVHKVSGSMNPPRREVHAVGGFNRIECWVHERGPK